MMDRWSRQRTAELAWRAQRLESVQRQREALDGLWFALAALSVTGSAGLYLRLLDEVEAWMDDDDGVAVCGDCQSCTLD